MTILPHIFVINLKRSPERRAAMTERLDPLGMSYSFFDAIDAKDFNLDSLEPYDKTWRRLYFGRDLKKGEMGCLLSHRAVYQHMVDAKIDRAIVLEDDVFLKPDFKQVITAILEQSLKWDMVRFLDSEKVYRNSRLVQKILPPYVLKRVMIASGGAYGYMLNQHAARTFLKYMNKNYLPVDILHGYVWRTALETFAVVPSPVSPDIIIDSTIGEARFDKTLEIRGWEKLAYPFTRSWLKFSELVGKRAAYWLTWPQDILRR